MYSNTTAVETKEVVCDYCNGAGMHFIYLKGEKVFIQCDNCEGFGKVAVIKDEQGVNIGSQTGEKMKCKRCEGTGIVRQYLNTTNGGYIDWACSDCQGIEETGESEDNIE